MAQSTGGASRLNGTITDPTGAVVPTARVVVINSATGLNRETQSTDAGLYEFPNLPVGTYDLTVEKTGFSGSKGPESFLQSEA